MHDSLMLFQEKIFKLKCVWFYLRKILQDVVNKLTWVGSRLLVVTRGWGLIIRGWGNLIDSDFSFKSAPELPWYILSAENHITLHNKIVKHIAIKNQEPTCNSLMVGWKARKVFPKFLATCKQISKTVPVRGGHQMVKEITGTKFMKNYKANV